jgi:hypothetical protein
MFKIILTVITLALIATSCNHNKRNGTNYHFDYDNIPDYGFEDVDGSVGEHPIARKIPEPSLLFSYALFSISCVIMKKK